MADRTGRALLAQAWPMLVAQLAFILTLTIDTAMAGRLSAEQLAGVSLGMNLYVTIAIGMLGCMTAIGPIVGQHYGAGQLPHVGRDLRQALWLAAFLALPGCAALAWHQPWLRLAQPDAEVAQVAHRYLSAAAFGLPGALATQAFVAMNPALSRPQFTMVINLTALLLKVPLNALFIWGAGPLPALGGAGCAVASACLSWFTFALAFVLWRRHPSFAPFRSGTQAAWAMPAWGRLRELLRIGVPTGLSSIFEIASFTLMAVLMVRLGAATLAGHQIVANLVSILYMVPMSIGYASSALVAQSVGARDGLRAQSACVHALQMAGAVSTALAALAWILREPIIAAYTNDPQVAAAARRLIGWAAAFHAFDGLQTVSAFVLRGYKVTLAPMLIYGACLWLLGLGGGYWLAYRGLAGLPPLGSVGLWAAAFAALGAAALCLVTLARRVAHRRAHLA